MERTIGWAAFRAAIQLLAAGFVLGLAFESNLLPWVWIGGMILYSAETVRRRAAGDYRVRNVGLLAVGGSTAVSLLVIFGLGVLDFTSVSLIVTAGITIGNTMPATVLAVTRTNEYLVTGRGELEGMLALGFSPTAGIQDGRGNRRQVGLDPPDRTYQGGRADRASWRHDRTAPGGGRSPPSSTHPTRRDVPGLGLGHNISAARNVGLGRQSVDQRPANSRKSRLTLFSPLPPCALLSLSTLPATGSEPVFIQPESRRMP